ncbi:nuclear transport factor 2 family protein [Nocardia flavorosea]|uniref:Nuclear transport factor 2 family protein n=1 Tax=Nocardia flavorosea TaxID=53429 RepID=A0A846YT65_9NOCA|nr:nuclear transport factor 2 family protein [Nocardia flavorosea]NKY60740.1 nuclear transport factor 2 family protein [Nocardia flavorosea]
MDPADRLALITLAARYAQAVDRRDIAAVAALCTSEVVFVLPPELRKTGSPAELRGSATVAQSVVGAVSHLVATRHVVEQQVTESDAAGRAYGETYCTAHHIYARGDDHRDNRIALRYQDTFEYQGGIWLFSRRELVADFAEDVPVTRPGR